MERGGDYKNVQVRHIIYSIKNIDFHIVDPLVVSKDKKPKYIINADTTIKKRNDSTRNAKSSWKSSYDNMKITPKKKKPNEGSVYYHCSKIRQKKRF